jgi:hypothetical protein
MRSPALLISLGVAAVTWCTVAGAQVNDGERAAARELFKEGDELQRAGHFAEALDKFQRAEQIFAAPTNELRIAECEAALGLLVESGEAYRSVLRTPLPPGAPAAFQAAVDQAKAEFAQVEPRIPKLVVEIQPVVSNVRLQMDGQRVSSALVGQAMPLDPGPHKVSVAAPGYSSAEQSLTLKERETRVVQLVLKAEVAASVAPPPAPTYAAPAPAAPAAMAPPPAASRGASVAGSAPPPPADAEEPVREPRRESRFGLLVGGHLGLEFAGGTLPPDPSDADEGSVDIGTVAGTGVAFGIDGGLRFGRRWYVGATLEHAAFSSTARSGGASADTTLAALVIAVIANPDRVSFYGEASLGSRWFHYTDPVTGTDTVREGGEFSLGSGVWIPIGRSFRLLPKATLGLGFDSDNSGNNNNAATTYYPHVFLMLGTAGFYNADF